MEPAYRSFGTEWASAVLDGEYARARELLAPWLAEDDEASAPGFDLWMAVVDVGGRLAIGSREPSEAD